MSSMPVHACPLELLINWFGACHSARPPCHHISPHHWGQLPAEDGMCVSTLLLLTRTIWITYLVLSSSGCTVSLQTVTSLLVFPRHFLESRGAAVEKEGIKRVSVYPLKLFLWAESSFWESFFLKFRHRVWSLTRTWPHDRNMVQISVPKGQNVIFQATWGHVLFGRPGVREIEDEHSSIHLVEMYSVFLALYCERCAWNYLILCFHIPHLLRYHQVCFIVYLRCCQLQFELSVLYSFVKWDGA